jgi:hypothetical protein
LMIDVYKEETGMIGKTGRATVCGGIPDIIRAAARAAMLFAAALLVLPGNSSQARAADISRILNFQAGYITDSNIYRTFDAVDREKDKAAAFSLSYGRRIQLTHAHRLSLTADIGNTIYDRSKGYNNTSAGLTASFFAKPGVGPLKPWARIFVSAARRNYNGNYWNGSQYELGIQAGKRVNNNFDMVASAVIQDKTAPNDVYNGNSYTTSITAGFGLLPALRLSAAYNLRRGDATLHSEDGWPDGTPWLYNREIDYFAYRVPAETRDLSVTAAYQLGRDIQFYITRERQNTDWGAESYPDNIFKTGLIFSTR